MQFVVSAALLASVKRAHFSATTHPPKSTLFDFYNSLTRARLKSSTRISSVVLLTLLRRFSAIPRSTSQTSLKSTWSVPLVSSYRQTRFLLFIGKEPNKSINPDETVVYHGCRSPSRHPLHRHSKKTQDLLLLDFAPLLPQYRY